MTSKILKLVSLILLMLILACNTKKTLVKGDYSGREPSAVREFRAAWIATVANINWPSKPGLSEQEQKKEAIHILNLLHKNNFNAAIFQVRPQCDAMYKSELEPWSYYLTGRQGVAPKNFYDPLKFWIEEAHKRGIELHAWLNPYRAHHVAGKELSQYSIVKRKPKLVVELSSGYWWMNPAEKGTQDHSYKVVMDIVNRYDIDGIHLDDYFYPYPSYHSGKDFPDDKTWNKYKDNGGKLARDDWRRDNVNKFIKRLYKGIKKAKPNVKFGISPFGVNRSYQPNSVGNVFDQYDKLYADAKLWLNKGWIDYWTPQLYWRINKTNLSFPVLLGWWNTQNTKKRHIWPGTNIVGMGSNEVIDETTNLIMISRGMLQNAPGMVWYSMAPIMKNPKLMQEIIGGPYKKQALIPEMPWLSKKQAKAPQITMKQIKDSINIECRHKDINNIRKWVVYYRYSKFWEYKIHGKSLAKINLPIWEIDNKYLKNNDLGVVKDKSKVLISIKEIAISAIDIYGNESELTRLKVKNLDLSDAPSIKRIVDTYKLQMLDEFSTKLNDKYDNYKEKAFTILKHKYDDIIPLVNNLSTNSIFAVKHIGNKNPNLISAGKGKKNVLLWSQIHGNESIATQALFDIFNFFKSKSSVFKEERKLILSKLNMNFIPMLNPDSNKCGTKFNAQEIDLNKDAINLKSAEAKILKHVRDSINAKYGFYLRVQGNNYKVATKSKPATISMLAPPFNEQRDINKNRRNAMKTIALINRVLQKYIPKQLSRYNDSFSPTAFGDNMQKWGTSTILIESVVYNNDTEKQYIRKINFIAILSALYSMALNNNDNELVSYKEYFNIPLNEK